MPIQDVLGPHVFRIDEPQWADLESEVLVTVRPGRVALVRENRPTRATLKKMPLETLEKASGAAFDRMFLDMMIEHHRDAIAMTRSAKLVMPSVQQFAHRTTQQQAAEIKEMEALRKAGWI